MAQGFSKEKGIDYSKIDSFVPNFSVLHFMSAATMALEWHTRHKHKKRVPKRKARKGTINKSPIPARNRKGKRNLSLNVPSTD